MSFCPNCGSELKQGAAICLSCGHLVQEIKPLEPVNQSSNTGKTLSLLSIIFGGLGFFPLIFIGSIAGFIMSLIVLSGSDKTYHSRAKIGLWLSVGSFILWILLYILYIWLIIEFFSIFGEIYY